MHDGLMISVADSGPGVPEHLREAIFARGVTSKPDVPGGRGIGLALVRLVTAQHGGTVEVSDGPFGRRAVRGAAARRHGRGFGGEGRTCVTCWWSTTISWSPRSTAGSSSRSTAFARSASPAPAPRRCRRPSELRPQLILLDVYLPDMTGLEVLQRLRSEGDRVGVIMITAARELDTVKGALDGGAADYLIKPFEFPQLKAKLEAFAARADALESAGGVDQSLIDSLFGGPAPARHRRRCCRRGWAPRRAGWCWTRCVMPARCRRPNAPTWWGFRGSARAATSSTTSSTGALELRLQYGVGRPERRYRLRRV